MWKKEKLFSERTIPEQRIGYLLAVVDGKGCWICSALQAFPLYKTAKQWLLSDLFVHPDYRGKGLSVALIDRSKNGVKKPELAG